MLGITTIARGGASLRSGALATLAFAVCMLAGCAPATPPSSAAKATPGQFDFEGWDQNGGGVDSSQYSSLKEIDKTNVGRLTVAWTYPSDEAYLFNPLIVNGTIYVLAKKRSIVALDAATGKEKWVHQNEGAVGARGMSYWKSSDGSEERLLYVNAGFLTAIDAKTGDTIESFGDKGRVEWPRPLCSWRAVSPRPAKPAS